MDERKGSSGVAGGTNDRKFSLLDGKEDFSEMTIVISLCFSTLILIGRNSDPGSGLGLRLNVTMEVIPQVEEFRS